MTTPVLRPGTRVAVINWRDPEHSLAGGSERYAWEFARALVEGGAHVDFVTARDAGQSRGAMVDGVRVRRGGGQFSFYAHAAAYLVRHRRVLDLVVDPSCGIPSFSPLFVRRRTPVVLVMHHVHQDQFATYFPPPLARLGQWLEGWLMPRVYRRVRTLAVSTSTAEELVDRIGWTTMPEILANGADLGTPNLDAPVAGRLVVLGRVVLHKRVDEVVRAVGHLVARGHDVSLDVVGKGPESERVSRLVDELGLRQRVRLHGFLPEDEKARVVAQGQVHVCASDAEGWGQVVIEAAGVGVPTLARDVPGLRDSVVPGSTGWLLPADDQRPLAEQLADGVLCALSELAGPGSQSRLRHACVAWARQHSWAHMRAEARRIAAEETAPQSRGTT